MQSLITAGSNVNTLNSSGSTALIQVIEGIYIHYLFDIYVYMHEYKYIYLCMYIYTVYMQIYTLYELFILNFQLPAYHN